MNEQQAQPLAVLSVLLFIGGFAVCAFIVFFWILIAVPTVGAIWRTGVAIWQAIPAAIRDGAMGIAGVIAGAYAIRFVVRRVNRRDDPCYVSLPDDASDGDGKSD